MRERGGVHHEENGERVDTMEGHTEDRCEKDVREKTETGRQRERQSKTPV